jgi:2-hydroxy-6-oxonona-2,4-dienedioate hydrolase
MPGKTGNPRPTDIVIAGKRLHAWIGGAGQALLLLHSAWGDAEMSWARVWNELSKTFTVIAPDLPGFGASDPLDEPTLSANANILKTLFDDQEIGRAIVVGNSFAASIAIEFASSFPERTKHLVLVNGGYVPALPGFVKRLLRLRFAEKHFRRFMRNFTYSDKAFAKSFPDPAALPPGFFERIRKNEEKQSRNVFDTFMNQAGPQAPPPVPSTLLWGTGDRLVTLKQLGLLRKWLGTAAFVAIDGAGHMPQVERPGEFVEAVKRLGKE